MNTYIVKLDGKSRLMSAVFLFGQCNLVETTGNSKVFTNILKVQLK